MCPHRNPERLKTTFGVLGEPKKTKRKARRPLKRTSPLSRLPRRLSPKRFKTISGAPGETRKTKRKVKKVLKKIVLLWLRCRRRRLRRRSLLNLQRLTNGLSILARRTRRRARRLQ